MSISLSTLRDYWKNVSDWVTGTSASKPVVSADIKGSVIKDSFSGTGSVTKTYETEMHGFSIVNDGDSNIAILINNLTFTVMVGEDFNGALDAFTSVQITTTSSYRATVKK